jgi:hypothetical protein
MKKAKLKQYGLTIYLIVSLFVSAVSAGGCWRHPKPVERAAETSCHQHSAGLNEISVDQEGGDSSEIARSVATNDKCCCIEPTAKITAKIENLKIEKQTLADVPASLVDATFEEQKITVKTELIALFYLTNSFYNLALGRAPPVL